MTTTIEKMIALSGGIQQKENALRDREHAIRAKLCNVQVGLLTIGELDEIIRSRTERLQRGRISDGPSEYSVERLEAIAKRLGI